MGWKIFVAHHVAHIQPTLQRGTAQTGYPIGTIRTLDRDTRARIQATTSPGIRIDFDRGADGLDPVDSVLILSHDLDDSTNTWGLSADDDVAFGSFTTLIAAHEPPDDDADIFRAFDADVTNTDRYLRFEYFGTNSVTYEIGVLSIGRTYDLAVTGPQIGTERGQAVLNVQSPNPRDGVERIARSFRAVNRADAEAILSAVAQFYLIAGGIVNGFGGGAGRNAIALVDTGQTPTKVYWGAASAIQTVPWGANATEVFVTLDQVRAGALL